ncbi:hypothetical protein M1146_03345, partial [Patescibacteria group bacterium]|nr:hypothetical protein [Patescibacteria group bacterium]
SDINQKSREVTSFSGFDPTKYFNIFLTLGKKCNKDHAGDLITAIIHYPTRHRMVHSSPMKKSPGKVCHYCQG